MDEFDFMGKKVADAFIGACEAIDHFQEPFRGGGICALEEFWFRCTGQHFDWDEFKIQSKKIDAAPDN